jgi:hypothetical protein
VVDEVRTASAVTMSYKRRPKKVRDAPSLLKRCYARVPTGYCNSAKKRKAGRCGFNNNKKAFEFFFFSSPARKEFSTKHTSEYERKTVRRWPLSKR